MKKIAVLISGSGTNLQAIIDKCLSGYIDAEIVCVLSSDPNAYGLERAKLNNIKTKIINENNGKNETKTSFIITEVGGISSAAGFGAIDGFNQALKTA